MSPRRSNQPEQARGGNSPADGILPPPAAVDIESPRFMESSVSLHSSRKLNEAANISKIIFCDQSRSLPDLQARVRSQAAALRAVIDPLVEALPHVQWNRSVWHSFDIPAGVETPHLMLDGSYYTKNAGDIREVLFKGNVVCSVLEHLDSMIDRTMTLEPPIDVDKILTASRFKMKERDREALIQTVQDFLGPVKMFPRQEPSGHPLHCLQLQIHNLRFACAALAYINEAVAQKMAQQIGASPPEYELAGEQDGIPVMRLKPGTLNPAHSAIVSPGLNAWESHPWISYLNDLRLQLCAAQYGFMYLVSYVPVEAVRIPNEILEELGRNFSTLKWYKEGSVQAETLEGLNQLFCTLQDEVSGWDALPLSPMFLPTRFEADLSYSCLGINMTRPELGAYSPLNARFMVSPDKLYNDPARQFWLQISENPGYKAALGQMPTKLIASIISEELGGDTLNVSWLGVGTSWFERSVTASFIESGIPISSLRVHEISADDSKKESDKFRSEFPAINVANVSGLFSEVDWEFKRTPSGRMLLCSLGGTMANIDLLETLQILSGAMREGDMLLFDSGRASEEDPRLHAPLSDVEKQWMWAGIHQVLPGLASGDFELELRKEEKPHGYDLNFIIHEKGGCFEYKMMRIARFSDEFVHSAARDNGLTPLGQWQYSGILCAHLFRKG